MSHTHFGECWLFGGALDLLEADQGNHQRSQGQSGDHHEAAVRTHAVDELAGNGRPGGGADGIHRAHPRHTLGQTRGRHQVQHELVAINPRWSLTYTDDQVDDHDDPQMLGEQERADTDVHHGQAEVETLS